MRVQKRLGKIYSPAEVVSNNIAPMTKYCLVKCSSPGNQALSSSSGDIRSLARRSFRLRCFRWPISVSCEGGLV